MQNPVKETNHCGLHPEVVELNKMTSSEKGKKSAIKPQVSKKELEKALNAVFFNKGGEGGESSGFIYGSASNPEFLSHSSSDAILPN